MNITSANSRFQNLIAYTKTGLHKPAEQSVYYKNLMHLISWESYEPTLFNQIQLKQLELLLHYAFKHSPWYEKILSDINYAPQQPLSEEFWQTLPILKRSDLIRHFEQIKNKVSPPQHGQVSPVQSSGSTGKPVKGLNTEYNHFFFQLNILREHLWHQRDFSRRFAIIRPDKISAHEHVLLQKAWGSPVSNLFQSNTAGIMHSSVPIDEQLKWLIEFKPSYLLTLPNNLKALLRLSIESNQPISDLLEVRTYGETVSSELRRSIKSYWNIPLTDVYTSTEAGYFAIQCAMHDHYHITSDTTRVEILDDNNEPCKPGQIGKVVVTPLHNFALPLIRYEIGDYAEFGNPCDCGCRYPIIKQVMGRSRNMLYTPEGKCWWPSFPSETWSQIVPAKQIQIVQDRLDHLFVTLVLDQPMNQTQQNQFRSALHQSLNYPFNIDFRYTSKIPRKKNCKFEDFISQINL